MSEFRPEKLYVDYKDGIGVKGSIIPRKYTLTHSDETGDLFLSIGKGHDYSKIGPLHDEVLATWQEKDGKKNLEVSLQIDGENGLGETIIRDNIFRHELPLALTAIVYGDMLFLEANEELFKAPIIIHFNSSIPEYNVIEDWGMVEDYKYNMKRPDEATVKQGFYPGQIKPQYPGVYPIFPPPYLPPIQPPKQQGKYKLIEDALITMLDPYIKNQVYVLFGRNTPYCLKRSEVLEAKKVNTYSPCTDEYEIIIGLRVGKNPPPYDNMIITFLINESVVKILDVKTPRG